MSSTRRNRRLAPLLLSCLGVAAIALAQCGAPAESSTGTRELGPGGPHGSAAAPAAIAAWTKIEAVLKHPRCLNCHPAGDAPLVGDASEPHPQNVHRGEDGNGLFAMRCDACHQDRNGEGAHLPPGAPRWHLPSKQMPLVFEGRRSGDLCRQLRDPAHNGGKTPEELLAHTERDPLVLWGWDPGAGRAPVATSHAAFVEAMRTWVANGCGCPEN